MKTIRILLLVLIIIGLVLLFTQNVWVPKLVNQILSWQGIHQPNPGSGAGERCGGNMMNAPTCSTGYHCAPEAGSHLPFGDVGGVCVSDTPLSTTTPVLPVKNSATVKGQVTLSPVCPVERMPPDPACAPRPYATTIKIFSAAGNRLVKTVQGDSNGRYTVMLSSGDYNFQAAGGATYPRCPLKEVIVKSDAVNVDISCDTGIR